MECVMMFRIQINLSVPATQALAERTAARRLVVIRRAVVMVCASLADVTVKTVSLDQAVRQSPPSWQLHRRKVFVKQHCDSAQDTETVMRLMLHVLVTMASVVHFAKRGAAKRDVLIMAVAKTTANVSVTKDLRVDFASIRHARIIVMGEGTALLAHASAVLDG